MEWLTLIKEAGPWGGWILAGYFGKWILDRIEKDTDSRVQLATALNGLTEVIKNGQERG